MPRGRCAGFAGAAKNRTTAERFVDPAVWL